MKKEDIIHKLGYKKAENNNTIDLDAYVIGVEECYNELEKEIADRDRTISNQKESYRKLQTELNCTNNKLKNLQQFIKDGHYNLFSIYSSIIAILDLVKKGNTHREKETLCNAGIAKYTNDKHLLKQNHIDTIYESDENLPF